MSIADLPQIAVKHDLQLVLQFGSTVTGREHERSDLDVGVLARRDPSFRQMGELIGDLQAAFSPRRVDVAFLRHAR